MVRRIDPNPRFYTWLWDEGLSYLEAGYLKIPPNTTAIFTDSGNGEVEGLQYATSGAGICMIGKEREGEKEGSRKEKNQPLEFLFFQP